MSDMVPRFVENFSSSSLTLYKENLKDGFQANDSIVFELVFPTEKGSLSPRFSLTVTPSQASFSSSYSSNCLDDTVVALLKCYLESCFITVVDSSQPLSSRIIAEPTVTAVRRLARRWLEACSSAELPVPKRPTLVHSRESSLGSLHTTIGNFWRPPLLSRASYLTSSSASSSATLAGPVPSVVLCQMFDEEKPRSPLFVQQAGSLLLNEALLTSIASGQWEVQQVNHQSSRSDAEKMSPTSSTSYLELPSASKAARLSFRQRIRNWLHHNYYLMEEPELVLPSPPDEKEKLSYLKTHRFWMCVIGVFAFLSSASGIWLFTLCGNIFYWFGLFAAFIQGYLALFHLTGLFSKNFDYKEHQKIVEEYAVSEDSAPTVDIYLPCCKEPLEILENTYKYAAKMKYPEGKLKVHVLDDGGMEEVKALATQYGFNYICRDDRPRLKKAGNLRWAFQRTSGDFFVIYDADFCPRHDFLLELIPRMKHDPKIAIIQTPQYFRVLPEQTWIEKGAGGVQELFYRYIQVNRNKWGAAICVGSNAMYRREALVATGGTAEVGASEDVHTGFFAVINGWKLWYTPLVLACGISPDTPRAFFSQQLRWCQGSTSLLLNIAFWKSKLTWSQKTCYLSGMLYYSTSALNIFINPLPGILLMWFRIEFLLYYNLVFAVPGLIYAWLIYSVWSHGNPGMAVQFIGPIQQYAYLSAIKDRILGTSFTWVPSGDNKAHKSNRYRNMRWLCICWNFTVNGFFVAGCIFRIWQGHKYWNFIPIAVFQAYLLFKTLPYMLAS